MVLGALIKGVSIAVPIVARYAGKYGRAEGRVFNRLYGTSRGRGVRHGSAIGGVAGALIKSDDGIRPDAEIPYKRNGSKANQQNKTRSGFKCYSGSGRGGRFHRCTCNRYTNSRRYN